MGKSATFENDILKLILNATPIANLADNTATSPLTNLFVALHTADPGSAGTQATNEVAYTGYTTRPSVARTGAGWVVTGNSASPAATINFGSCTASPGPAATYASVGVSATVASASKILWSGALTTPITITVGQAPQILASSTITET